MHNQDSLLFKIGELNMYELPCPKCQTVRVFKSRAGYLRSKKKNLLCIKCCQDSEKLSLLKKEWHLQLTEEQKKKRNETLIHAANVSWSIDEAEYKKRSEQRARFAKQLWLNNDFKEKRVQNIRDSWNSLNDYEKEARINRLINNEANRKTKIYTISEFKCQGTCELRYLLKQMEEDNPPSCKGKPRGIKTPYGFYFPDFEYDSHYVEIKSKYTYSKFINRLSYDGITENKQYDKVLWVSQNIKPVHVIVEEKKNVFTKMEVI